MAEIEKAAFICVKDTLDGAYHSLVLGINAACQGMETKISYSFMGLNLVLKGGVERAKFFPPGVMGAIPGMTTLATGMMKKKIEQANIPSLADMQEMAQLEGVEFHWLVIPYRQVGQGVRLEDHRLKFAYRQHRQIQKPHYRPNSRRV